MRTESPGRGVGLPSTRGNILLVAAALLTGACQADPASPPSDEPDAAVRGSSAPDSSAAADDSAGSDSSTSDGASSDRGRPEPVGDCPAREAGGDSGAADAATPGRGP